jgi:hypothetical protein
MAKFNKNVDKEKRIKRAKPWNRPQGKRVDYYEE